MEATFPRQNVADDIRPSNFIGTLKITVFRAQHLPQGIFGNAATIDPYLKLRLDNADQAQRGVVHEKAGNNPNFAETFMFELQGSERGINVEIWDETLIKNTELASAFIRIDDLVKTTEQKEEWFHLSRKKNEDGGSILLQARFVGDSPDGRWPRDQGMLSSILPSSSDTQQKRASEFTSSEYRAAPPASTFAASSTTTTSSSIMPVEVHEQPKQVTRLDNDFDNRRAEDVDKSKDWSSSALGIHQQPKQVTRIDNDFDNRKAEDVDKSKDWSSSALGIHQQPKQVARVDDRPLQPGMDQSEKNTSLDMSSLKQDLPRSSDWNRGGVSSGISGNEPIEFSKQQQQPYYPSSAEQPRLNEDAEALKTIARESRPLQ